jgi:hypothetical protein
MSDEHYAHLGLEADASSCTLCSEIRERGKEVRELASALIRLHKTITPVLDTYQKLKRSHPQCASCGIMAGPDGQHLITELTPEPMVPRAKGQKRYNVCKWCYQDLHKARKSVPQQRKHQLDIEQMFKDQDAIDWIEEDVAE